VRPAAPGCAVQAVGERLVRSLKPPDKGLGKLVLEELLPALVERQEAEERRARATERVQRRLGGGSSSAVDLGRCARAAAPRPMRGRASRAAKLSAASPRSSPTTCCA
jgi:hypothetical protein